MQNRIITVRWVNRLNPDFILSALRVVRRGFVSRISFTEFCVKLIKLINILASIAFHPQPFPHNIFQTKIRNELTIFIQNVTNFSMVQTAIRNVHVTKKTQLGVMLKQENVNVHLDGEVHNATKV